MHKNGNPVFIAFDGKIGYAENGDFLQTHCILKDISTEKKLENYLRINEEKYRTLFETMTLGVVYQAGDGRIISANPAAEQILGYSSGEMTGQTTASPMWRIFHEDGSVATVDSHPSVIPLKTGNPCGPTVFRIYNAKISDDVWIKINSIPLFHEGEAAPYSVYTLFQDITAERKADRNYYLLFHEMVDAFALHEIICDDTGKPVDYRFIAVNTAFERMTGLLADHIVGKTVMEVLPETESFWIQKFGNVAITGEPVQFENYSIAQHQHFVVNAYQLI